MTIRVSLLALALASLFLDARPAAASGDARLVGTWRTGRSYMSGSGSSSFSARIEEHLVLKADGTCLFYTNGYANSAAGPSIAPSKKPVLTNTGTWSTSLRGKDKIITIKYKDGRGLSRVYFYAKRDNGASMMFKAGSSNTLWTKTR